MHSNGRHRTHRVTATTEQVIAVIASLEHRDFSVIEVIARLPHLDRRSIIATIVAKMRQGWLQRVTKGRYRMSGARIRTRLPQAIVAEALWATLSTDPERRFKRLGELVEEAETFLDRPGVSLYHSLAPHLTDGHKHGWLERTGRHGHYAYRLAEGVIERPVMHH